MSPDSPPPPAEPTTLSAICWAEALSAEALADWLDAVANGEPMHSRIEIAVLIEAAERLRGESPLQARQGLQDGR